MICQGDGMMTSWKRAHLLSALTLTLLGFSTSQVDAQNIKEAGASYQKNCMSCHQPPDLRFATDRAWVGQIRETA
ncbi:MAG: hypothetical protein VCA73_07910 [Roseibacillus sp.]|jgi:mono/diheme cytochrome c family protein